MNPFDALKKRIVQYRRRKKIIHCTEQGLQFLFFAALGILVLPLIYKLGKNDFIFRWLISLATTAAFLYFFARKIISPLISLVIQRQTPTIDQSAFEIGSEFSEIKDDLSNALQLMQEEKNANDPFVRKAFDHIAGRAAKLNFLNSFSYKVIKQYLGAIFAVYVLIFACIVFWGASYQESITLLVQPGKAPANRVLKFSVRPGSTQIARGESLEITAGIEGAYFSPPELILMPATGAQDVARMIQTDTVNVFTSQLENINASFAYQIGAEKSLSEKFFVEVIDYPEILTLQLYVQPPAYTKLKSDTLEQNIGDVAVLPGSEIQFDIVPNKEVLTAKLVLSDSAQIATEKIDNRFTARLNVYNPMKYVIQLKDALALTNKSPIEYDISLKKDEFPSVKIEVPGKDMDLDESMEMPLRILGEDDFGFSKLNLVYRILTPGKSDSTRFQQKPLRFKNHDQALLASTIWELISLEIYPEDVVEYFVELYDNDAVSGPKKAQSKIYRLRLPSINELFSESENTQDEAGSSVEEIYETSRELEERVENVLQNIRRNQELKWQDEQAIKETMHQQNEMLETLEDVRENLQEMVDRLDKNDLLALETLEKYQELQDLLEKIDSPKLREMMEKMQQALDKMDPTQMQKSLQNFQAVQEEFMQNIEKTIHLLKQLEAEQKLDETLQLAEQMAEKQQQINENLQENQFSETLQKSITEQKEQTGQLDQIAENLQSLQKSAESLPQMQLPMDMLSDIQQQAGQIGQEMQNTLQQMQSANHKGARQSGQRLSQQMQQMQSSLSKMQQQMQKNQRSEVMNALKQSRRNILRLSRRQENLAGRSGKNDPMQYRDIAQKQQDLLNAMQRTGEQMYRLSEKSFFVPPEISSKLGEAQQKMQSSISELEKNRGAKAGEQQQDAMQALNGALSELQQAMQSLQGQSSGSSMLDQFLQQMQSMSQQQQGINQGTQQLGHQGQLTPSQQGELMRLATQQEALRQALERLQSQRESREMLGSLDKIAEEMREAAKEMRGRQVNPETIERQERILSRLLDAQKSVRKQEFSKKRQSRSGKEYLALDPENLPEFSDSKREQLKRDLLRALRANYSKDYKALIQKYFEALTRELDDQ